MPRPPDVLDRDIFAQSRAPPEAAFAASPAGARVPRSTPQAWPLILGEAFARARATRVVVVAFMRAKPGPVVGVSNLRTHAAVRGETPEAFRKAGNATGAHQSAAGADATLFDRDRKHTGAGS